MCRNICYRTKENYGQDLLKRIYLLLFNIYQTVGFAYVLVNVAILYLKSGTSSFAIVYDEVGSVVQLLHIMQIMEIIHPMIGLTKGFPTVAFWQLAGRLFILFVMIQPEPRMHAKPIIPYLFTIWGSIEVIRHLYYVAQLLKKEYPLLTWMRYTLWIVLYPMGILGEANVMITNLPYLQDTMRYSITLPNPWNISVNAVILVKFQIFILVCPVMYYLTSHMYKIRAKKMANFKYFSC